MTAQLAGNEVVYSVVLPRAGNPLSREDVEGHFKAEPFEKIAFEVCEMRLNGLHLAS